MTPKLESTIPDTELGPGEDCPVCGESIVTWMARQHNEDHIEEKGVEDGFCWIYADDVEPTGLTTGFAGNIIVIDHKGPSMETE